MLLAAAAGLGWLFFLQPGSDGQRDLVLTLIGFAVVLPLLGMAAYLIWYGVRRMRWRRRNVVRTGNRYLGIWERTPRSAVTSPGADSPDPRSRWDWLIDLGRILGP